MQETPSMVRIIALFAVAAVLLGMTVGGYLVLNGAGDDQFAECRRGTVVGGAAIGGPFDLVSETGDAITDAEAITDLTLLYFGYTFCPDFCPNDLSRNAIAADMLEERGVNVNLAFVSIDPARDTVEAVADFTDALHPRLLGMTGTSDQVSAAATAYKVYFRKAGDDPEYYLMDHSTFTYLVAPEVGFLEFFPSDTSPEELADTVGCFASRL
jgi:protein SCO1/2